MNKQSLAAKKYLKKSAFIIPLLILLLFQSCENDPNDLGLNYISVNDTTGVRFLDSQADTMFVSSTNYLNHINNYFADLILAGKYQSYDSKALLKFYNLPRDKDSAVIISAVLTLRYGNYYFKDKNGLTDFNVYKVISDLNYNTVTYDSVSSSDFGTSVLGNYSGVVADSSSINITLNNDLVNDWFKFAADTSYAVKNNGIVLMPNAGSSSIKGFFLKNVDESLQPVVKVILSKNNVTDTVLVNTSVGLTLSNAPASVIPAERFLLQNGIAYRNILKFDLTKLPANVIINNANLQFTLDKSASFISENTDKRIVIGMVTDSITRKDSIYTNASLLDTITYSVNLNPVFQRWNSGTMPNLGITLKNIFELQNLDNFVFYTSAAADISKRPRLKITYTLRN
ncbi:MAG: DNRLRE domain-containing protein [Bacteroidetes bacterium]|nr:DNRLRE domain-containing protein [Bacteroidota bacterium]